MSEERLRSFCEMVHRILVIADDWLCDQFGFSRRGKGKYASLPTDAVRGRTIVAKRGFDFELSQ